MEAKRKFLRKDDLKYTLMTVLTFAIFLILWQVLAMNNLIVGEYTPSPSEVLKAFIFKMNYVGPDGNLLITNILTSLKISMSGFVLAVIIGIPLGLLMGWYRLLDRFVRPIFEIVRPIPAVSWIPLMIVWIGVGTEAKAVIIFLTAFIPCVLNSYTGIRQTSQALINVAKVYGASNFYTFLHVGVPSTVPMIFAGMRIALASSWSCLVAAEMLAASAGLGYMINMGRNFGRADVVVLGMIVIGFIGYIFTAIFTVIEKIVVRGGTV